MTDELITVIVLAVVWTPLVIWLLRQDLGHDAAGQSLINRWWLP